MKRVFADTFYFLALANPRDFAHRAAVRLKLGEDTQLVTTAWVMTELADAFASVADRTLFQRIWDNLRTDPGTLVVPADPKWFEAGLALYLARADKNWSLTDCISFEVMREQGIVEALTGDRHFVQAGFRALLLVR